MASPNQEGPSEAPPQLPEGWLAQWYAINFSMIANALNTKAGNRRRENTITYSEQPDTRNGTYEHSRRKIELNSLTRDIPTQPALSVPTPETTPHHADTDPFQKPPEASSGEDGGDGSYEGTDRGFLSVSCAPHVAVHWTTHFQYPGSCDERCHGRKAA